jgi:hypothetical protein
MEENTISKSKSCPRFQTSPSVGKYNRSCREFIKVGKQLAQVPRSWQKFPKLANRLQRKKVPDPGATEVGNNSVSVPP